MESRTSCMKCMNTICLRFEIRHQQGTLTCCACLPLYLLALLHITSCHIYIYSHILQASFRQSKPSLSLLNLWITYRKCEYIKRVNKTAEQNKKHTSNHKNKIPSIIIQMKKWDHNQYFDQSVCYGWLWIIYGCLRLCACIKCSIIKSVLFQRVQMHSFWKQQERKHKTHNVHTFNTYSFVVRRFSYWNARLRTWWRQKANQVIISCISTLKQDSFVKLRCEMRRSFFFFFYRSAFFLFLLIIVVDVGVVDLLRFHLLQLISKTNKNSCRHQMFPICWNWMIGIWPKYKQN